LSTAQNRHRRVQEGPSSRKVAVPRRKQVIWLGQRASAQTVCKACRRTVVITAGQSADPLMRILSHGGLDGCRFMAALFTTADQSDFQWMSMRRLSVRLARL
jgi:hypothetical protein